MWHGPCRTYRPMPALPRSDRGSSGQPAWPRGPSGKLLRPVLAAAALSFLLADDGIGRDEFLCEAAVVHLAQCCPDFLVKALYCVRSGCDGSATPDLNEDRAQCLREKTCAELRALGACDPSRWEPVATCVEPCSPKVPACH